MNKAWIAIVSALVSSASGLLACSDNGASQGPEGEGDSATAGKDGGNGTEAGAAADATASDSPLEVAASPGLDGRDASAIDSSFDSAASPGLDGGDASAPATPRLLLSYNGSTSSELVAFGLQSGAVDGVYVYPDYIGATSVTPAAPWVLEQSTDIVGRLDPARPWVVQSSFRVALGDYAPDAGFASAYSDPLAVVAAGTKAYVLRYNRNTIAVIDPSQVVDGGAPASTIDLSAQVQAAGDGYVEMSGAHYDPPSKLLYLLLANIDRFDVAADGYTQLCSATHPTLVAIDTTTDAVVNLGDAGTRGYSLPGYGAVFGAAPMVYDPPNNRLLVLETGCKTAEGDGGVGPIAGRGVVSVSLADGAAQTVLDLTSAAYPSGIYYLDAHHTILQLDTAYTWDPTTSTLGPAIANAPEAFDVDPNGNLVGVTQTATADGGAGEWLVVSVNPADGGTATLGTNPFPMGDAGVGPGYLGGAQLWPAP